MKVYAIPGMGADRRIFHKISLPRNYELELIDWIEPLPDESLRLYSERLLAQIDTSEPFGLMGLSMGGMIAVSFAQIHVPEFIVLVSSVAASADLPPYYRWFTGITDKLPLEVLKFLSRLKRSILNESDEDKELLVEMINSSDNKFLRWSISAVLQWQCEVPATKIFHIHGKDDWILPVRYLQSSPYIITGGHAMILSEAEKIQHWLNETFSAADDAASA